MQENNPKQMLFNVTRSNEALISKRIDRLEDMIVINQANFLDVYNVTQKNTGAVAFNNWLIKDKTTKREFFRVILRKLINYLGTSTTLIDHTRKLIRSNYANTVIEKSYNEQIELFFRNSNINIFVIELRNFFMHFAIPILSRQFKIDGDNSTEIVSLDKDKLLNQSFTWKKQSIDFIQSLPKNFEICSVLFQYQKLRDDFYPHFIQSLYAFHKNELSQFNEWRKEWNNYVADGFQI